METEEKIELTKYLKCIVADFYREHNAVPNEVTIDKELYQKLTKVFDMSLVCTAPLTLKIKGRTDVHFVVDNNISEPVAGYNKDFETGYDMKHTIEVAI